MNERDAEQSGEHTLILASLNANTLTWSAPMSRFESFGSYEVVAIDQAGLRSDPLNVMHTPELDEVPLTWPSDATIVIDQIEERSLRVSWPTAYGNPTTYQVYSDDTLVTTVDPEPPREWVISDLSPMSQPLISIVALGEGERVSPRLSQRVDLPDLSAPIWPDDARLSVGINRETSVLLEWTPAVDLTGVDRYLIALNGHILDRTQNRLLGTSLWTEIDGLAPWTFYELDVFAEDSSGLRSEALHLRFRTADGTPPSWTAESALTLTPQDTSTLRVHWPSAIDQVGVAQYSIFLDGQQRHTLQAEPERGAYETDLNQLRAWSSYEVSVYAIDEANQVSLALSAQVQMPDPDGPTWDPDATLIVDELLSTSAELSFSPAHDEGGVSHYEVRVDGEVWTQLQINPDEETPDTYRVELIGLRPGATLLIEAFALDQADNRSAPLTTTIVTLDGRRPYWEEDSRLRSVVGNAAVRLSWDVAYDDVGVTGYYIYQGEELIAEVAPDAEPSFLIDSVLPEQTYIFTVYAFDASGKRSDGLSREVTTAKAFDPGFRRLSQEQFLRTLADLHGWIWTQECQHPRFGPDGCSWPRTSTDFYRIFTAQSYGDWLDFRRGYPSDEVVSPEGLPRGGFKRFDQIIFPQHISSWLTSVKLIANDYEHWVGANHLVRPNCVWNNQQGVTQYGSTEEIHRACFSNWIERFAPRALRRPITLDELENYLSIYDSMFKFSPEAAFKGSQPIV